MRTVNLIVKKSRAGLARSTGIIASLLRAVGMRVDVTVLRMNGGPERFELICNDLARGVAHWRRAILGRRYDLNLFVETIVPPFFELARCQALVPNQEWFRLHDELALGKIDRVFSKSRHAEAIFRALGREVRHVGFTSLDRADERTPRDERACLHIGGHSSDQRNTAAVIAAWARHPEWPRLHLAIAAPPYPTGLPDNVRLFAGHRDDDELARLQNACGIHVLPSRAEGFGHTICEAMSCRAIAITTDAPPMNELVSEERGVVCAWKEAAPMRLGTAFEVDPDALDQGVERALALDRRERHERTARARAWYLDNDRTFRALMVDAVRELTA